MQVGIDGQEWRALKARRSGFGKLGPELELPRLGAPIEMEAPASFGIEPHERLRVVRGTKHERIAYVIDPVIQAARVSDSEFVTEVRAEVVDSKFELPVVDAISQRDANSIIGCLEIANLVERESHHGSSLDVELPPLR